MWQCPKCGERSPSGFSTCLSCGEEQVVNPTEAAEEGTPPVDAPLAPPTTPAERRQLWGEVAIVLCIGVLPHLWAAAQAWMFPSPDTRSSTQVFTWLLGHSLIVIAPVCLVLARSGTPWRCFGILKLRPVLDVGLGVLLFFLFWTLELALNQCIPAQLFHLAPAPESTEPLRPLLLGGWLLVIAAQLANGVAEELVIRGYLLTRLQQLLDSSVGAILLSSMLFGAYHVSWSVGHALSVMMTGACYAIAFLMIRRLWPLVLAHALHNLALELARQLLTP